MAEHHAHGAAAGECEREAHSGERRRGEVGAEDVVAADDADVLGHADTALPEPAEHADRDEVVEGDARRRSRVDGGVRGGGTRVDERGVRADPGDADLAATALREAEEEVGLDPDSVTVVAQLPKLWIPVSDFVVTPVLAWWRRPHEVHPRQPAEVAHVARLPVSELVDPANRLSVRHPSGWVGPAFQVRGMLVWGFTAGVIGALLEMGGWAVPWPADRVADLPPNGASPAPSAG